MNPPVKRYATLKAPETLLFEIKNSKCSFGTRIFRRMCYGRLPPLDLNCGQREKGDELIEAVRSIV